MRYLITGANGFVGEYLAEELSRTDSPVIACVQFSTPVLERLNQHLKLLYPDITKAEEIGPAILDSEPDVIFHLAAQSFPRVSWEKPVMTMEVNLIGSVHILEAIRKLKKPPTLVVLGSSAEYAPHPRQSPIREDDPLQPSSIYGVSKLAIDEVARLYSLRYHLPIIRTRPFFLIGPRKENDFCSDMARRIALVEKGKEKSVSVGDLRNVRDFLDVRDGVQALILLSKQGMPGEAYNICSGQGYVLRTILEKLKSFAKVSIREEVDPGLMRDYDEPIKIGNPEKLQSLGWKINYDIHETLLDILNYWRSRL